MKKIIYVLAILSMFLQPYAVFAKNLEVEYLGETQKLFTTSDDFFVNISNVLPGDVVTDTAILKNTSNETIKLYFKTEPIVKEEYKLKEDYELLEKMILKIIVRQNNTEQTVYEGHLAASNLSEFQSIGTYKPNEQAEFIFTVKVPNELDNTYNMTNTKVKWVFGVGTEESKNPDTADSSVISKYVLGCIASLAALSLLVLAKNKKPIR